MKKDKKGVVYSAAGEKYVKEAIISAKSLRNYNENINISIFIDDKKYLGNNRKVFDSIFKLNKPEYSCGDKLYAMRHTPYLKTFFLDTDTIITDDISEIFEILDKFEIAAANVAYNFYSYPHYNAGLLAFSMNKNMENFLDFWNNSYNREIENHDQGAFQRTLAQKHVSLFTLPPNYNFRPKFASYVKGKIKIIHCHTLNMDESERTRFIYYLNSSYKERVWLPRKKLIINFKEQPNIFLKFLYYLDIFFLKKINFWKFFSRRWLFHYLVIYYFPWLINWVIPMEYRRRMFKLNKKMKNLNS